MLCFRNYNNWNDWNDSSLDSACLESFCARHIPLSTTYMIDLFNWVNVTLVYYDGGLVCPISHSTSYITAQSSYHMAQSWYQTVKQHSPHIT